MTTTFWTGPAYATVLAVFVVAGVAAQEPSDFLTGQVLDELGKPLVGVLVLVGAGAEPTTSARTAPDGAFRLEDLVPGTYRVRFRKEGFTALSVTYAVESGSDNEIDAVSLETGPNPTATLVGEVTDTAGNPVSGAEVVVNGDVAAFTGANGRFRVEAAPVTWGSNHIFIRRISYAEEEQDFWIGDPDSTVPFEFVLGTEPVEIAGVVADGLRRPEVEMVIPGFRERRASANGYFLNQSEIRESNPGSMTEVVQRAPGLNIRQLPGGPELTFSRRTRSLSQRDSLSLPGDRCRSPVIFVDGVVVGPGSRRYMPIDDLVNLEDVAGVEIYNGASRIPTRFNRMGSSCGVLAIWTTRSLVDSRTLPPSADPQLGPEGPEGDSGVSFKEVVLGSAIVGAVAALFWKAVCGQPHFCR